MKHLILVILLALAPLSWGEDELVLYCVGETRAFYEAGVLVTTDLKDWRKTYRITEKNVESAYHGVTTKFPIVSESDEIMDTVSATAVHGMRVKTFQFWQEDINTSIYEMYLTESLPGFASIIYANCTKF